MAGKFDDDEYVANLLKQDAQSATKRYELVGIDAFNPKRPKSGAPKPNKGFLRHLLHQTDSHNAALLAKEAEESNTRLRLMNREKEREIRKEENRKLKKAEGRLTPVRSEDEAYHRPTKRRNDHSEDDHRRDGRYKKRDRDDSRDARSGKHRDEHRHKRRHDSSDEDRSVRKRRQPRSYHDQDRRHRHSSREEDDRSHTTERTDRKHRRRRSYSRSTSRSRSQSDRDTKRHRHRHRSRSPRPKPRNSRSDPTTKSRQRTASPASDSDPLEALVGPLPPPTVRARGRGAHKANNATGGIESRFSSTYDPSIDVRPHSDAEDNWGDALEAFRDRQRWKQQGADRLKAAGFSDAQVKKWEKGDEQNEEDVVWTSRGQAREWDRGKVVDEDGDVELKADFGRLK
ncbi:uncharacterized protein K460DRAFT_344262 [Cucurbitaria berberidis CBS 394.84]|uniref:Pre-mRNA-splicing factor 38B n=1 Tax=Cucurbitaria berberidis CBS 394.84 TaxID=1168544 RepID=A0A9P4L4Z9_9PLEO|nr:uncharacterized protein K460DRAFT_344262 [Cucurbitaria berberidis CBS 394.84]KAF1841463.1 hypothetical protein K460DRAFT_344262 [Cucurbitaria berberidis CBS 394.84]